MITVESMRMLGNLSVIGFYYVHVGCHSNWHNGP